MLLRNRRLWAAAFPKRDWSRFDGQCPDGGLRGLPGRLSHVPFLLAVLACLVPRMPVRATADWSWWVTQAFRLLRKGSRPPRSPVGAAPPEFASRSGPKTACGFLAAWQRTPDNPAADPEGLFELGHALALEGDSVRIDDLIVKDAGSVHSSQLSDVTFVLHHRVTSASVKNRRIEWTAPCPFPSGDVGR